MNTIEEVRKLAKHFRDNYPQESRKIIHGDFKLLPSDFAIAANYLEEYVMIKSQKEPLDCCLQCGGIADNGHDKEFLPSPYFCKKCENETFSYSNDDSFLSPSIEAVNLAKQIQDPSYIEFYTLNDAAILIQEAFDKIKFDVLKKMS
jgi:hypothetical protein